MWCVVWTVFTNASLLQIVQRASPIRIDQRNEQKEGVQKKRIGWLHNAANVRRRVGCGKLQIICAILHQIAGLSAYRHLSQSGCGGRLSAAARNVHIEFDAATTKSSESRML